VPSRTCSSACRCCRVFVEGIASLSERAWWGRDYFLRTFFDPGGGLEGQPGQAQFFVKVPQFLAEGGVQLLSLRAGLQVLQHPWTTRVISSKYRLSSVWRNWV
jgi:hypothetical protein